MKISNFNDFKLEKSNLITGGLNEIGDGCWQKTWYDCNDGSGGQDWKKDYVEC